VPNKTITQIPVAAGHVLQVRIAPDPETGLLTATTQYRRMTDTGQPLGTGAVAVPLTAPQRATLVDFVINVVLPVANATEGT